MNDYEKCGATSDKRDGTCIKFAGHPGRCRFSRMYETPVTKKAVSK